MSICGKADVHVFQPCTAHDKDVQAAVAVGGEGGKSGVRLSSSGQEVDAELLSRAIVYERRTTSISFFSLFLCVSLSLSLLKEQRLIMNEERARERVGGVDIDESERIHFNVFLSFTGGLDRPLYRDSHPTSHLAH